MFLVLTNCDGYITVLNITEIECVFVGKIDRKGNTATIVQFRSGDYCCVSESVSEVAEKLKDWKVFMLSKSGDMLIHLSFVERIFVRNYKGKQHTVIICNSGSSYITSDNLTDFYSLTEFYD